MSLFSSLFGTTQSASGRVPSFNDFSLGAATDAESDLSLSVEDEIPAAAQHTKEALHSPHSDIWHSTFNPGMNSNMKVTQRSHYDTVEKNAKKPLSVWGNIAKSENIKRVSFNTFDTNKDGFIDAAELQAQLSSGADVADLIKQADKNHDGKIDFKEFCELLKES